MGNFIITTHPSLPIEDINFTLTITDSFVENGGMIQSIYEPYQLTLADTYVVNDYTIVDDNTLRFNGINIPVSGSIPIKITDSYSTTHGGETNNIWNDTITIDSVCYVEGTEILCLIDGEEKYVKIEDLTKGILVKTYISETKCDYKKMAGSRKSTIYPSKTHNNSKIYVLKKNKLGKGKPYKDLYVTGAHSYLVDEINDDIKLEKMKCLFGKARSKLYNKYKLLVSYSEEWENTGYVNPFTLYHFALENSNIYDHYGVYANGILSESMNIENLIIRKKI